MKEFIGRVTYPLRFSTSLSLSSTGRLTHASMSRTGVTMSLVSTDSGAVSRGVLDLSSLLFLSFFFGAGDLEVLDLLVLNGESVCVRADRPLLVRMPSLVVFDLGVGG